MNRTTRVAPLLAAGLVMAVAACKKKPEAAPTPAVNADSAARADAEARERARQDSIAAAERAAADAASSDRADRERRLGEARSAVTAAIYFDFDKAEITDQARATLDAKLPVLTANPGMRIRVAGNTDSRGSDEYNLALGQRRAAAAKHYLVLQGIDASRIEVISYGEERPVAQGEDESAYSQNRRDEFEITAGGENLQLPKS
jgi:peptidoglycan-associated lipoprotein